MKNIVLILGAVLFFVLGIQLVRRPSIDEPIKLPSVSDPSRPSDEVKPSHPLSIQSLRERDFPASSLTRVRDLGVSQGVKREIVSYISDGLTINALLLTPTTVVPEGGFPAIVFNHGYIAPEVYRTNERYEAYQMGFARAGFIVLKPDYRGHDTSQGQPEGAYYSQAYTIDVLHAFATLAMQENVNPDRIGMWGHSMGGHITLKAMVVQNNIKAGVIWAGVVASHADMLSSWRSTQPWQPSTREQNARRPSRQVLIDTHGDPSSNPSFWNSISPIFHVKDISGPLQIHHGESDTTVPYAFSVSLQTAMEKEGKESTLYLYPGADHNVSGFAFNQAMSRSVQFFKDTL